MIKLTKLQIFHFLFLALNQAEDGLPNIVSRLTVDEKINFR